MKQHHINFFSSASILICALAAGGATTQPLGARQIFDTAQQSIVGVQYTWQSDLGRHDLIGTGVVISDDGLIACSLVLFNPQIPDSQMKDFKILIPTSFGEPDELDAIFVGRDERSKLAFLKPKTKRKWTPIHFKDEPVHVGDTVYSVGLLPKAVGYRGYLEQGIVSAELHRDQPLVMVTPGLAAGGAPVFSSDGAAIGLVMPQNIMQAFLNDPQTGMSGVESPSMFFFPTRDFLFAFTDLPTPGKPQKLPWMGVVELQGLKRDITEYYGLPKDRAAVQVGDVIPNTPADKAGMKRGMIIVSMNGKPLERGDDPDQAPQILRRNLLRMRIGEKVSFGVLSAPNQKPQNITLTLAQRPPSASTANRYWADDLGFGARDLVFDDTYVRHLPADAKGVIVTVVKPQSSAMTARLQRDDMITEINGTPVTDIDQFKKAYESLRKSKPKEAILLVVLHEGNNQVIRIEPPQ